MASNAKHQEKVAPHKAAFQCNSITQQGYEDMKFLWESMQLMDYTWDEARIKAIGKKYGWDKD